MTGPGVYARSEACDAAVMPPRYYTLQVPRMIALGTDALEATRKADLDLTGP